MIKRILESKIIHHLNKGKIIHIPGPRQIGKTTILQQIISNISRKVLVLNGDDADTRELFSNASSTKLRSITGNNKILILDEAQRILNIGLALKIIHDNFHDIRVIATGSSAFELANEISEPLTGRKTELFLFPVSFSEMVYHTSALEELRLLEHRMIYGYYPEVVSMPGEEQNILRRLTGSYLYKDIFDWKNIKKPAFLEKLLQALALQIGSEVSYNELAQTTGLDNETVEKYIDLLEKAYIIFRLPALSRNIRNELKKSRKIYFYDTGIRNSIIKNFNTLALRSDAGALWENFMIAERMKTNHYEGKWVNSFFWRTHAQQEIDYIEEYGGKFYAYEFKLNPRKKFKFPKAFIDSYNIGETNVISKENFIDFISFDKF